MQNAAGTDRKTQPRYLSYVGPVWARFGHGSCGFLSKLVNTDSWSERHFRAG